MGRSTAMASIGCREGRLQNQRAQGDSVPSGQALGRWMRRAGNLKAQSHWGCMRRCTLSQATVTAGKGRDLRRGALPQELRCFQWFPGWQCWPELVGGALPVTSPFFSLFFCIAAVLAGWLWCPGRWHLVGCHTGKLCHPIILIPILVGCQSAHRHWYLRHGHRLRGLHWGPQGEQVPTAHCECVGPLCGSRCHQLYFRGLSSTRGVAQENTL